MPTSYQPQWSDRLAHQPAPPAPPSVGREHQPPSQACRRKPLTDPARPDANLGKLGKPAASVLIEINRTRTFATQPALKTLSAADAAQILDDTALSYPPPPPRHQTQRSRWRRSPCTRPTGWSQWRRTRGWTRGRPWRRPWRWGWPRPRPRPTQSHPRSPRRTRRPAARYSPRTERGDAPGLLPGLLLPAVQLVRGTTCCTARRPSPRPCRLADLSRQASACPA